MVNQGLVWRRLRKGWERKKCVLVRYEEVERAGKEVKECTGFLHLHDVVEGHLQCTTCHLHGRSGSRKTGHAAMSSSNEAKSVSSTKRTLFMIEMCFWC